MDIFHFRKFEEPGPHNAILTIGNFDGVHLGHQALIRQVVGEAEQMGVNSALLTFQPHPQSVLREDPLPILTTTPLRLRLFERLGLGGAYFIPFTREFSRKTPEEFVNEYLLAYFQVKKLTIGPDFHFGRDRSGSVEVLTRLGKEWGFQFEVFPEFSVNGEKVSSSTIRSLLGNGDFEGAERLLGRPFSILETVVAGERRGRKIGFPTANIVPEAPLPLHHGVYASRVAIRERLYNGVTNYGLRPTVGSDRSLLETFLLDFEGDLYGELAEVFPVRLLRAERKFPSLEALRKQISADREEARKYFAGIY